MHPQGFDRETLVGGAYHEIDPRICFVLVNYSQETIDGSWGEFCEEIGYGGAVEEEKPVKVSCGDKLRWWRRLWRKT